MAMLDLTLGIRSVTFTQDRQSGSLTMLDLVRPYRLKMHDAEAPSTTVTTGDQKPPASATTPLPPVM
jgi:hypothetical protein